MRRSVFNGSLRAMWAAATLTAREQVRRGGFGIVVVLFLVVMAFYRLPDADFSDRVITARLLDYALGATTALVVMAAIFAAVGARARDVRTGASALEAERLMGPGAWFWGRALGITIVVCLLGLVLGSITLLHWSWRTGRVDYEVLEHVHSDAFEGARLPIWLDERGDTVDLEFPLDTREIETGYVRGRLHARLVLSREGAPLRTRYPIKLTLTDPDGSWRRSTVVRTVEGRPARFDLSLPSKGRPRRVIVRIEKLSPFYRIKLYRDDITLVGAAHSLPASILRGALVSSLFASVVGVVALFLALRLSWAVGLLAACGVVVLVVSLEAIEVTLLSTFDPATRVRMLDLVRIFLPDFDAYDVAGSLARGIAVPWRDAIDLLVRLAATALIGGLIQAWARPRRVLA